jgi:CheY-like chemotaxis protein
MGRPSIPGKEPSDFLAPKAARPLLLCIEDDPMHLLLRRKVLEQDGYDVIGVTTASAALETLREAPICCTIADHMLQGSTGVELAAQMKKIKPDVPIVLFSGNLPKHLRSIDVYVNKGEPTDAFLNIVHDVVARYCA